MSFLNGTSVFFSNVSDCASISYGFGCIVNPNLFVNIICVLAGCLLGYWIHFIQTVKEVKK